MVGEVKMPFPWHDYLQKPNQEVETRKDVVVDEVFVKVAVCQPFGARDIILARRRLLFIHDTSCWAVAKVVSIERI